MDIALLAGKSAAGLSPFVLSPAGLGDCGHPLYRQSELGACKGGSGLVTFGCLGNPVRLGTVSVSVKGPELRGKG